MKISQRMQPIAPSATLAVTNKAKQMKAAGIDVLGFAAGEPDFPTPSFIVDAMVRAARDGATGYGPAAGLPALRQAAADHFTEHYEVDVSPDQCVVSVGGKHALYNLFQVLVDPGDEVIILAPYWVSYPAQIKLAGGHPVVVSGDPESGFELDLEALSAAVTDRTVGIVVNSPSNPSGLVFSPETLEGIAQLADRKDLWVISDDIYSHLRYDDGAFDGLFRLRPDLRERIIVVHGTSKTYSMTGWRVGFTVAPTQVVKKLSILQSQSTSNPTSFAQYGAIAALKSDHSFLPAWLKAYNERRVRITELLNAMDGVKAKLPGGAFYVFPDLRQLMGRSYKGETIEGDLHFAQLLLEHERVAIVPGSPFDAPGFARLSYACGMEDIERGLSRMKSFVDALD